MVTWGDGAAGGDSSTVQEQLRGVRQAGACCGVYSSGSGVFLSYLIKWCFSYLIKRLNTLLASTSYLTGYLMLAPMIWLPKLRPCLMDVENLRLSFFLVYSFVLSLVSKHVFARLGDPT